MNLCQRCKKESTSWTNDTVRLVGDVRAHLCVNCINAVTDQIQELSDFKRLEELDAEQAHQCLRSNCGEQVAKREVEKLYREQRTIKRLIRPKVLELCQPIEQPESTT